MSTQSTVPAFGRRWQLQILTAPENGSQVVWTVGQDAWLPEALRVTFDINKNGYVDAWYGEIDIYNLNLPTQQAVILEGYEVILSAGYQSGANYGVIFRGRVFQVLWTRENVVDYKLTLHCMVGLYETNYNIATFTAAGGVSQRDIILRMAEQAQTKFNVTQLDSSTLGTKILPRGEVVFGSVAKYLSEVANGNGLQFWTGSTGINLADISPKTNNPQYTYSAVPDPANNSGRQSDISYTIIGTPQQIPEGVEFRILLDSRLDVVAPAMVVKIDNTVIRQMKAYLGNLPPILAQDGNYIVANVRHRGDTRGQDWYTDVLGLWTVNQLVGALEQYKTLSSRQ